ncbi:MAG: leucine-rich repeat domain-containing protein [Pseudomonadota bacterium]
MSAEEAYRAAQAVIVNSMSMGSMALDFDTEGCRDLAEIPPEIGQLERLENLDLSNTQIADLTPIAGLSGLTRLDLHNSQVADLAPIAGLSALTRLYLDNTQVADLISISELTALKSLYLNNTQVSDLTPISGLLNLTTLAISDTNTADLKPISNLTKLGQRGSLGGLFFEDIIATKFDPELARLSEIDNDEDRTEQTLAYLRAQRDRTPDPPEDRPNAPSFTLPEGGPITPAASPLAADDPTQAALHDEVRRKTQRLITVIGDSNQHALLRDDVLAYAEVIDPPETDILADLLLSRFNTLRHALEAHQAHTAADHIDALPEAIARALQDLIETHGLYALGKPGMAEAEARAREILEGPTNPDAIDPLRQIADSLAAHPGVATPEATALLQTDAKTADPTTPSGRIGLGRGLAIFWNMLGTAARAAWTVTKAGTSLTAGSILGQAIPGWLKANQAVIELYFAAFTGSVPAWFTWLMSLL